MFPHLTNHTSGDQPLERTTFSMQKCSKELITRDREIDQIPCMMLILGVSWKLAILLVFGISLLTHQHVTCSSEPNYVNHRCNDTFGNYTIESPYKQSLDLVLSELTKKSSSSMSGYSEITENPVKVYGLFYCRGDLDTEICSSCIKSGSDKILSNCPVQKDAMIWYQECTLRYFANNSASYLEKDGNWTGLYSFTNVSDPSQFVVKFTRAISPLMNKTAYGSRVPGFETGEVNISRVQTLYCLVQCSPFSTGDHCNQCLNGALDKINSCCSNGSTQLMIFNPSCQLRYDILPFYNLNSASQQNAQSPGSSPASAPSAHSPPAVYYVTRVVVPVALALLLACIGLWQRTKLLKVINSFKYNPVESHRNQGAKNYSFREMKKATGNFSEANELGHGGFGAVYKGLLEDGKEVAIKRLKEGSGQGDEEFSKEVMYLAELQHRNLVRLLGYCAENKERILVYEYLPNSSLDKILFVATLSKKLDWKTRYKIIVGIARGLQYLHNESRLNVVHRDLKASNILVDADMIPKIADFGLAKQIELDQTRGDTNRCAGTRGYMAPELMLYGEFSTKSDVFSFGVMLLEILSGKINLFGAQTNLVSDAWRLWREGKPEELIDPTLKNDSIKVLRCIKIALLCLQEHASTRPHMQDVLFYLYKNSVDVPSPITPTFHSYDTSIATSIMDPSRRMNPRQSGDQLFRSCTDESLATQASEEDLYPR